MNRLNRCCVLLFVLLSFSACSVGPEFIRPSVNVPATWSGRPADPKQTDTTQTDITGLSNWWETFNDPLLSLLIQRGLQDNLDIKQAQLRIIQARASKKIAVSAGFPNIDAAFSYLRNRTASPAMTSSLYEEGLDAGWEVDLFGRVKRSAEASEAEVLAAIETKRDVLVSLGAEVATSYLRLRMYQNQHEIARKSLENQQMTLEIATQKFDAGFVSAIDVTAFETQKALTEARIFSLETEIQKTIYAISVLLGQNPVSLVKELEKTGDIPIARKTLPSGVPSGLLRRRPDIRRAEAAIHSATAQIGVSEADLFPRFFLTGSLGMRQKKSLPSLDWADRFWSIGPSVQWNVFAAGRTVATIELQKLLQEESVLKYRKTVLEALKEVEEMIFSLLQEQRRVQALTEAAAAAEKTFELAKQLYRHGQTDYLAALDAERSLLSAKDSLVQSRQQLTFYHVALYKALGGGWSEQETNLVYD